MAFNPMQYVNLPPGPPTAISPDEEVLRRLTSHSFSQDELPSLLKMVFSSKESTNMVHRLQRDDARVMVNILEKVRHALYLQGKRLFISLQCSID